MRLVGLLTGGRAFHQDATEAMRGDIVRGLIEAITNCDDAYGDKSGKIRVEVEHRHGEWKVIVRDRARGMSADQLKRAIGDLGGRTSVLRPVRACVETSVEEPRT